MRFRWLIEFPALLVPYGILIWWNDRLWGHRWAFCFTLLCVASYAAGRWVRSLEEK
jgi:hypothetical protein